VLTYKDALSSPNGFKQANLSVSFGADIPWRRLSMRFKTRQLEENACNLYPAKRSPMRCFIGGKTVHKKWKHLLNSSHKGIKKMHASQCGDSDTSRNKMESVWR